MSTEIILDAAEITEINVTLLPPKLKHPTIFEEFDLIGPGQAFRILNDHDPKPLYYQLVAERGNIFTWTYLEKGPVWWRVELRKLEESDEPTIGQIAAADIRTAEVFRKFGIDYCCGGKRTLSDVCTEKGLNITAVRDALNNITTERSGPQLQFDTWDADFLADYIFNQHHKYYYEEEPVITELVNKVAEHHGKAENSLLQLQQLYRVLLQELNTHFMKEEKVVFPFVKALMRVKRTNDTTVLRNQMSLTEPIRIMESDHDAAGDILAQMRSVTNDYTPPANACNSYRFMFQKLKDLEADLHQHIHLENNVLFPKALALEKEVRGS